MRFLGSGSVRLTHYRFLQHFRFLILSVIIAHVLALTPPHTSYKPLIEFKFSCRELNRP